MREIQHRVALAIAAAILGSASVACAATYRAPRTASGAADLQGVWDNESITSLERPPEFKTNEVSDAAATAFERDANDPDKADAEFKKAYPRAPDVGAPFTEFPTGKIYKLARIAGKARAAILIDPADGKLPLSPEARSRIKINRLQETRNFDSAELRPLAERCLIIPGPPMIAGDSLQIVQTDDDVVINTESGQEVRIIHLKDKRHGPPQITPWMGDSIGRWEGDTLVVETTNFNPGMARWRPGGRTPLSTSAKVTERFTRTSTSEILYRFTVEDPVNYAKPWSGVLPFTASHLGMLSYECHEGNYALANILAGARRVERDGGVPEPLDGGDPPVPAK